MRSTGGAARRPAGGRLDCAASASSCARRSTHARRRGAALKLLAISKSYYASDGQFSAHPVYRSLYSLLLSFHVLLTAFIAQSCVGCSVYLIFFLGSRLQLEIIHMRRPFADDCGLYNIEYLIYDSLLDLIRYTYFLIYRQIGIFLAGFTSLCAAAGFSALTGASRSVLLPLFLYSARANSAAAAP